MALTGVDPLGLTATGAVPEYRTGCGAFDGCGGDDWGIITGGGMGGDGSGGYDIFDAIAGAPGTYLQYDSYGRLSWGFSIELWQQTLATVDTLRDSDRQQSGVSGLGPYPTWGFVTIVEADGSRSGLLQDYQTAVAEYNMLACPGCVFPWGIDPSLQKEIGDLNAKISDLGLQILKLALPNWNPDDFGQ